MGFKDCAQTKGAADDENPLYVNLGNLLDSMVAEIGIRQASELSADRACAPYLIRKVNHLMSAYPQSISSLEWALLDLCWPECIRAHWSSYGRRSLHQQQLQRNLLAPDLSRSSLAAVRSFIVSLESCCDGLLGRIEIFLCLVAQTFQERMDSHLLLAVEAEFGTFYKCVEYQPVHIC